MDDDSTLWVGGLDDQVTEDHLYELFMQVGPLDKVTRIKEKDGTLKKFAFVEFSHPESVPYAIQVMDGIKLFNHHLRLKGRLGSQHEHSHSPSPSHHHAHHNDPSNRGHSGSRPEYHRSRSHHNSDDRKRGPHAPLISQSSHPGSGHHKRSADDRSSDRPFNGPSDPLSQPFSNTATYSAHNMQPQSFEERRNRVLQKQNMSSSYQAQQQGMGGQHGGYNNFNFPQAFNPYGNTPQGQWNQQW